MKKLHALVILWLALPLAILANPHHNPCYPHPCHAEVPEPNTAVLILAVLLIIGGWKLAKMARKEGGE